MRKDFIKKITSIIIAVVVVFIMSGSSKVYATQTSLIDFDYLYNTLIVGDMSYASTLYYNGSIDAYMASDSDGIAIYVPDDPAGGTGTGVGIYRQNQEPTNKYGFYTIYYGEFVDFVRNGHGSIYKTYKDSEYTCTRSFYADWENDYPNGQGNESFTEEEYGNSKRVEEASGLYIGTKFTGTVNKTISKYAGSKYNDDEIDTWSVPYVNGFMEGTVIGTYQKAGYPQETVTYAMSGGFPVNDRTNEYLSLSRTAYGFDSQTQIIVGWAEQNHYYVTESRINPATYDYSIRYALE